MRLHYRDTDSNYDCFLLFSVRKHENETIQHHVAMQITSKLGIIQKLQSHESVISQHCKR